MVNKFYHLFIVKKWLNGNYHQYKYRKTARRLLISHFWWSPSIGSTGRTVSETIEIARDIAEKLIEASQEKDRREIHLQESFDYPLIVGLWWEDWPIWHKGRSSINWKKLGFWFYRQAAGSHELWHHPEENIFTTIPNHPGNIPEGTVRAIMKQAQVAIDDFLQA